EPSGMARRRICSFPEARYFLRFLFTWCKIRISCSQLYLTAAILTTQYQPSIGLWSYQKASVKFPLLCRPLHLAGVEIVIAFDDANLGCEFAEMGLTFESSPRPQCHFHESRSLGIPSFPL